MTCGFFLLFSFILIIGVAYLDQKLILSFRKKEADYFIKSNSFIKKIYIGTLSLFKSAFLTGILFYLTLLDLILNSQKDSLLYSIMYVILLLFIVKYIKSKFSEQFDIDAFIYWSYLHIPFFVAIIVAIVYTTLNYSAFVNLLTNKSIFLKLKNL